MPRLLSACAAVFQERCCRLFIGMRASIAIVLAVTAFPVAAGTVGGPPFPDMLAESGLSGGVVVHVGCGDGRTTASALGLGPFLVQGLDRDAAAIVAAQALVPPAHGEGQLFFRVWDGTRLPYVDR